MGAQIRWTGREWRVIARHFIEKDIAPDERGFITNVVKAMKAGIDKDRWRGAQALSNKSCRKLLAEAIAVEKAVKPAEIRMEELPPERSVSELVDELAQRIACTIADEIKRALVGVTADAVHQVTGKKPQPHCPEPTPEARPRKPRIMVVGPLPPQQGVIKKDCPNVDLVFVANTDSPSHIKPRAAGCKAIVLWVDFISHSHGDLAKSTGLPVMLCTGGVGAVSRGVMSAAQ